MNTILFLPVRHCALVLSFVCLAMTTTAQSFRAVASFVNENGKLLTEISINGIKGRFLLDTGAPTCVSHSFAQKAGLSLGETLRGSDSNGQSVATQLVTIPALQFGGATFTQLQALCWEKGNPTEAFIDGIIGYNLMQLGTSIFDLRRQRFTFTTDTRPHNPEAERYALPLLGGKAYPYIPIRFEGQPADTVMFDSGAADFYEMSTRRFARLSPADSLGVRLLAKGTGVLSMGAAGIERPSEKHRLLISSLSLAEAKFHNVTSITTSANDSRIGSELLVHGIVVIDYPQRKFYFLPYTPDSIPDLYAKEWDVVITVTDGYLTAGMVWNEQLPIRSGDRIVAVNGQRFDKVDLRTAVTQGLFAMPGDTAIITFLNPRTQREERIEIGRR